MDLVNIPCGNEFNVLELISFVLHVQVGGESLDQLYQRCTSSLQRTGRNHKGKCYCRCFFYTYSHITEFTEILFNYGDSKV